MRLLIEQARQRFRDQTQHPICYRARKRQSNDAVLCLTLYGKKNEGMVFLSFEKLFTTLGMIQSKAYTAPLPPLSTLMGVELFIVADMVVRLNLDETSQTWSGISGGESWLSPPAIGGEIEHYDNAELYHWTGEVEETNGECETVSLYEVDYFLYRLLAYLPSSENMIKQIVEKLATLAQYNEAEHHAFYREVITARQPHVGVSH